MSEKNIKIGSFDCEINGEDIVISKIGECDVVESELSFNKKELKDVEKVIEKIKDFFQEEYGKKVFGVE